MASQNTGRAAREQAKAFKSIFAPRELVLNDDNVIEIPPHPNLRMLDDDRQEAYEELLFETESYDRGPDIYIPEREEKDRNGAPTGVIFPAETIPGPILEPYRKTGPDGKTELVKPPHTVRVVQAALGDAVYAKLRAGGKSAADVWRIWNEQGLEITERADVDPKSNGGATDLANISAPNRR